MKDLCSFLPAWTRQFAALVECEPDVYKHNMPHPSTDAAIQMYVRMQAGGKGLFFLKKRDLYACMRAFGLCVFLCVAV